jgi:hypothetical protein
LCWFQLLRLLLLRVSPKQFHLCQCSCSKDQDNRAEDGESWKLAQKQLLLLPDCDVSRAKRVLLLHTALPASAAGIV